MDQSQSEQARPGFVSNLGTMARNLFALFVTRVELAAIELGEARDQIARILLAGALGVLLLCFALAGWTALVIVLAWEALGWKILLLVALFYTLLAGAVLMVARSMLSADKLSLPATMAELRSDRDALF